MKVATRVLVTGATGFVGSHLVEAVGEGAALRALVRRTSATGVLEHHGAELVVGGLDDRGALARAVEGTDVVVHMAALTHAGSEAEYTRVNVEGTRALVEAVLAARPRPRRLVYLSSLAASGPSLDGRPVGRRDTPRPLTAYGRTKLAGEAVCDEAAREGVEVAVLRAAAVYGPRDTDLLHFFRLASWGVLPVPTGPARPLQLVHAADLAQALMSAVQAPVAAGVYHIAEPRAYAWEEVTRKVAAAVGRRARTVRVPASAIRAAAAVSESVGRLAGGVGIFNRDKARELLAPGWLCETDAARLELGFEAETPLDAGLAQTAQWYRDNGWL